MLQAKQTLKVSFSRPGRAVAIVGDDQVDARARLAFDLLLHLLVPGSEGTIRSTHTTLYLSELVWRDVMAVPASSPYLLYRLARPTRLSLGIRILTGTRPSVATLIQCTNKLWKP